MNSLVLNLLGKVIGQYFYSKRKKFKQLLILYGSFLHWIHILLSKLSTSLKNIKVLLINIKALKISLTIKLAK